MFVIDNEVGGAVVADRGQRGEGAHAGSTHQRRPGARPSQRQRSLLHLPRHTLRLRR